MVDRWRCPIKRAAVSVQVCLLLLVPAAASGQATFRGIGAPNTRVHAVSADGRTLVGIQGLSAFRWTASGGGEFVLLPRAMHPCDQTPKDPDCGTLSARAYAVSADGGTVIGGYGYYGVGFVNVLPFRWTAVEGTTGIGNGWNGEALAITPDGLRAFGIIDSPHGTMVSEWTELTGWTVVPPGIAALGWGGPNPFTGLLSVATPDNRTLLAGTAFVEGSSAAFLADVDAQSVNWLGHLPSGDVSFSEAHSISRSGRWIAGRSLSESGLEGTRWSENTGMIGLGDLPGGDFDSNSVGVSDDGTVVGYGAVLFQGNPRFPRAFIWDESTGMRDLQAALQDDYRLDLTGWRLYRASGITPDGRTIVGWGRSPSGETEGWVAYLGPPCPADFNHDGALTSADFFDFLGALLAGDGRADFNADARLNSQDLFDFLVAFFEGCG